jgi:hypothetical protein
MALLPSVCLITLPRLLRLPDVYVSTNWGNVAGLGGGGRAD